MPQYTVTFYPRNIQIVAQEGDNLLALVRQANISLTSACGGNGACGKCKVIIRKGEVHTKAQAGQASFINLREREQGYVLACLTTIHGDLEVEIPPESQLDDEQILMDAEQLVTEELERETETFSPAKETVPPFLAMTSKVHLVLPPPTLEDSIDDLGRLLRGIRKWQQIPVIQTNLANLKRLGKFLRESVWDVTALLGRHNQAVEVIFLAPGDTSDRNYGVAVDIGTTTIVAHLVNLATGKTVGTIGKSNSQSIFGADVISRIIYA